MPQKFCLDEILLHAPVTYHTWAL